MKTALLGLLLTVSAGQGSLGVGLDVLPEAYTFAARRLNVALDMRLSRCDEMSCLWRLGYGVELTAYVSRHDLNITRLEAGSGLGGAASEGGIAWFQKTCQGIVALVLPEETQLEVRSIGDQIAEASSQSRDVEIRRGERRVRFYGAHTAGSGSERLRCGVVAEAF